MLKIKMALAGMFVFALFAMQPAQAHCDSVDGPVAKTVQKALEDGNVYPVLAYAPASAEAEIRAAFESSRHVRALSGEARSLADRAFMETVIRLHRAGEGAPYTGLKPAGIDYGPAIRAAEEAVETGDLASVELVLTEEIKHGLRERFDHVRAVQSAPREPRTAEGVTHARERVSAELGFITFAESLRQAALGQGAEHRD